MKNVKTPFISTATEYEPTSEKEPASFTNHTYIGTIEATIPEEVSSLFTDSIFKKSLQITIDHAHNIYKGKNKDYFKELLLSIMQREIAHNIELDNLDIEVEALQKFVVGEKEPQTIIAGGSKGEPKTYHDEINLKYCLLTNKLGDNLSLDEKIEAIKKLTGKAPETKIPNPSSPSGLE